MPTLQLHFLPFIKDSFFAGTIRHDPKGPNTMQRNYNR
uniref:Uncharacterized protein n=1 Tax=Anguilla anguilla TaxID=7936 RepID=A0A0E9QV70_ANGAN